MLWRVQIKPHDDIQFLRKLGIIAYLEGLHQMRLQTVGMPDPPYRGFTQPGCCRHCAGAPVRGVERLLLCGFANYFGCSVVAYRAWSAWSRCILGQRADSAIQITIAPSCSLLRGDSEFRRAFLILQSRPGPQYDSLPFHQSRVQWPSARQLLQRSQTLLIPPPRSSNAHKSSPLL